MLDDTNQEARPRDSATYDLAALRRGDNAAFKHIIQQHHRALLAVARGMVGPNDADEIVQASWVKAYRSIMQFEGRSQLRTWLTSIVMNDARMHLRHARRHPQLTDESDNGVLTDRFDERGMWRRAPTQWSAHGPEDIVLGEELGECLQRSLAGLPLQQRLVLELRDVQGMSFDSICTELELSAANVRVLLHRARTRVYAALDRYEETGQC